MSTNPAIHVHHSHSVPSTKSNSLSPLNFSPNGASGTRSPSSIGESMPSSPTSIHSSSSAIFERDIETPATALPHLKDPHHTARAVAHSPLESAVPSVLSAAVVALGDVDPSGHASPKKGSSMDDISVIAPAPLSPQNYSGASGGTGSIRYGSRSPSPNLMPLPGLPPLSSSPSRISSKPLRLASNGSLTSIPSTDTNPQPESATSPSLIGIVPPTPNVNTFGFNPSPRAVSSSPPSATASPLVVTPPLPGNVPIARSTASTSRSPSRPTSIALEEWSLAPLVQTTADSIVPVPEGVEPIALSGSAAHARPPSPNANSAASKRLSFISYNDLLNSTPVSAFPLSSVTTASEPPHQVDVTLRATSGGAARSTSSRQSTLNRSPVSDVFSPPVTSMEDGLANANEVGAKVGGEWQREGFGTGLEERLEAAFKEQQARDSTTGSISFVNA